MPHDEPSRLELAYPGPLRDRLVAAVLAGAKTATTGLWQEYERLGEALPAAGERSIVVDSAGRPVAVVETTDVRVLPLGAIDLAYVSEEGYSSVPEWRADHERFWGSAETRAALGDPDFTVDDRTLVVTQRFRVVERIAARSAGELLDIVDENDQVIGTARRAEAYARGLRHRCVFVLVRDGQDRIFVHRRTAGKLVFPSRHDMFVGGVVGAGESYDDAALREAEEELGVRGLAPPVPLFSFLYEDAEAGHAWWSRVYSARWDGPVSPQAEEVAWHAFLGEDELDRRLAEWEWVPDGREAYRRLRARARPD